MNVNPEFRRNLWLELTPHRVFMMPAVLAVVFLLAGQFDPIGLGPVVAHVALGLAVLLSIAWGGYLAGEAMLGELRARTWDSQRMSTLGPWSMAWGKVFGATIFTWYGSAICLLVYVAGSRDASHDIVSMTVITVVAGGMLVQCANIIMALAVGRLVRQVKGTHGFLTIAATLLTLWVSYKSYFGANGPVVWFGQATPLLNFLMASLVALACWMLLGVYRMMCIELQVLTLPWAWIAFIFYLTVFVAGTLIDPRWSVPSMLSVLSDLGLGVSIVATYLAAFTFYRDRHALRRMSACASASRWRRMIEEMPLWLASAIITALFALACALTNPVPGSVTLYADSLGPAALVFWLVMVRDLLILLFFSYAPAAPRPALTATIYLVLLHWLIPSLLRQFGLFQSSWLISPPIQDKPVLSGFIIALHVAIVGPLVWHRYHTHIAPPPAHQDRTPACCAKDTA